MDIVLASTSPRRIDMMKALGVDFRTVDPMVNEASVYTSDPRTTAMARAEAKALTVAAQSKDAMVVAADTVVVLDGEVLDKASDGTDVRKMLTQLSGKEHQVMTAVAVCYPGFTDALVEVDIAEVTFRQLSEKEIDWYVSTGEGEGKAGGYAVQGMGGQLIEAVDGDRETVIGLPSSLLTKMLEGY
jgi:septum formation protein